MDKLRKEQEQRGFDTAFDINLVESNTHWLEDGGPSSRFSFRKRAKINYAEPSCSPNEEIDSDYEVHEEQKRTKRVHFHEEKLKEKSSSGIRISHHQTKVKMMNRH
ncbi:unnamed protein product [Rhizophagus irregularis]|nr:unnamed protein product [Rhizophagus irregularis]